jgi:negative regulator of sigma E activity
VASGAGTVAITLTGTNYTPSSKVYIDGVLQNSVYVSPTSLTVANAPKRVSAGTRSVTVTNGFNGPSSTAATWTFT